jgi:MFS family permease
MEDFEARIGGEDIQLPSSIRTVALASFIGSTVEWYDFFVYGTAAALVFGELFFPQVSPVIGTLSAFATFGVGFLFRPLGGAFFGHFGDRIGRKAMLTCILITAALGFVSKPLYGALSDRIGRRPIYLAGSLIGALVTFPFFWALETRVVIVIFLAFSSLSTSPTTSTTPPTSRLPASCPLSASSWPRRRSGRISPRWTPLNGRSWRSQGSGKGEKGSGLRMSLGPLSRTACDGPR